MRISRLPGRDRRVQQRGSELPAPRSAVAGPKPWSLEAAGALGVLVAALGVGVSVSAQGCSGEPTTTHLAPAGGGTSSGACSALQCPQYAVYCADGMVSPQGGCAASGCISRDEAIAAGGQVCGDKGVGRVVEFPPGVAPTFDQPDGGSSTGASHCEGNKVVQSYYVDDCARAAQVCREDGSGVAACVDAAPGDACEEEGALACTAAGQSAVLCQGGVYTPTELRCLDTPGYCYTNVGAHDRYTCGTFERMRIYSATGSPCAKEGSAACSLDSKSVNKCRGGLWTDEVHCAPLDCAWVAQNDGSNGYIACENGGYSSGDVCSFEGKVACSVDLTAVLECSGGVLGTHKGCPGGQECKQLPGNVLDCASSGYAVGDLCNFPDGYKRCSADQTQILSCVGEKMALEKACSGGQSCLVVVEQGLTVPGCH